MEEPKGTILSAQLVRDKEIIGSVERTLHFIEEKELPEEEASAIKTLEDIINDFLDSIEKTCKEKKVTIIDKTKLSFDLTIKLLLAFKAEDKKILVEVPVKNQPEEKTEGDKTDEHSDQGRKDY